MYVSGRQEIFTLATLVEIYYQPINMPYKSSNWLLDERNIAVKKIDPFQSSAAID